MKLKFMKKSLFLFFIAIALSLSAAQPRYIFYYIGDGMGMGPVVAAEMYNRQVLGNDTPILMMQFPTAGFCLTYSASSPVTDSAAAGTALSTGVKTKNSMLGMDPDTVAVTSVAKILFDHGYGVGLVTTCSPDDATPGAFFAHVPNRGMAYEIDVQAAESGYQFMAGGDLRGWRDRQGNATELPQVLESNNVQLVRGLPALAEVQSDRIILVGEEGCDPNNTGYAIDGDGAMTLPAMTEACIQHLERVTPDAFFMMVEDGNIDHALHANDGGAAIADVLKFNEALQYAYDFYKQHPDETLIIVTADHDTGGLAIGNKFTGYMAHLELVGCQKVSKEQFEKYCRSILESKRRYDWADMQRYLTENFGFWETITLTEAQDKSLREKFEATFELRNSEDQNTMYANFNQFAVEVFKIFNDHAGFGFIATSHTGNPVPVFAVGVGADKFTHLNNNIEIPATILSLINQN